MRETSTLGEAPWSHVLIRALDRRYDGIVKLVEPTGQRHLVEFRRGLVSRVSARDGYATLGSVLEDAGVFREGELASLLANGGLLGQQLVKHNIIDEKTLKRALLLQSLTRLVRVFSFAAGTKWTYSEGHNPTSGLPEGVPIDTLRVLWAGVYTHGEHKNWFDTSLGKLSESPLMVRADVDISRFGLRGDVLQLAMRLADEAMTLTEIETESDVPTEVAKRLVYVLAISRHLEIAPLGQRVARTVPEAEPSSTDGTESDDDSSREEKGPRRRVGRIKLKRVAVRASRKGKAKVPTTLVSQGQGGPRLRDFDASSEPTLPTIDRADLVIAEIRGELMALQTTTPFELLDIDADELRSLPTADLDEFLWAKYLEASAPFKPDAIAADATAEVRFTNAKIYGAMTDGLVALMDPHGREALLNESGAEGGAAPQAPGSEPGDAHPSQLAEQALRFLTEERFDDAESAAAQACRLAVGDLNYLSLHLWIRGAKPGADHASLVHALGELLARDPQHLQCLYYRGIMRMRAGDSAGARRDLERVLYLEASHRGAIRYLGELSQ